MSIDPAALPDDIDALKRIISELARDAVAARAEIEKLRFQLARFKRAQFGRSSEKIERTIEQLELAMRVDLPGVRPDRLDRHALDGGGGRDERVGQLVRRQLDHEVVGGAARRAFDHVHAQDVRADRAQRRRDRAERAGAVGQDESQQIGHACQPALSPCPRRYRPGTRLRVGVPRP